MTKSYLEQLEESYLWVSQKCGSEVGNAWKTLYSNFVAGLEKELESATGSRAITFSANLKIAKECVSIDAVIFSTDFRSR